MVIERLACFAALAILVAPNGALGFQAERVGVRLIAVGSEAEGNQLRDRVDRGESFDGLAREHSVDPSRADGGYLGEFLPGELRNEFAEALAGLVPGEVSPLVPIGNEYFLLGVLTEPEQEWIDENRRGLQAFGQGDYDQAERALRAAVAQAEAFPAGDYRLAESVKNLADIHYSVQDSQLAGPLYQRFVSLLDAGVRVTDPITLARVLNTLGEIDRSEQDYAEAEALYARSLNVLEEFGAEDVRVASILGNLALVRESVKDYLGAEDYLRRALDILERVQGPDSEALATGLNNLALLLQRQEKYDAAEQVVRRSLGILESVLRADHPDIVESLTILASVLEAQTRYGDAQDVYRRLLGIDWRLPSDTEGSPAVVEVLERLTKALEMAPFDDDQYSQAFDSFETSVETLAPVGLLQLALAKLIAQFGLTDESEAILSYTALSFPNTRVVRRELGELYFAEERMVEAIEEFELGSRLRSVPGVDDRAELSYFHRRIGDVHSSLGGFEDAFTAYSSAVEMDPENYYAHFGLGSLHARNGRFEEALASYTRAIQIDPDREDGHFRLAEANLNMGRFQESYAAAERVLEIDPEHLDAHFLRMRTLRLMGRSEEAEAELEQYRTRQAESQDREKRLADADLLHASATSALTEGRYDDSMELYRTAIEAQPDIGAFYLELGSVLGRLGRHQEAIDTYEEIVDLGIDDFLVHKSLAREYDLLGDASLAERHQTTYLRMIVASLKAALD